MGSGPDSHFSVESLATRDCTSLLERYNDVIFSKRWFIKTPPYFSSGMATPESASRGCDAAAKVFKMFFADLLEGITVGICQIEILQW